MKLNKTWSMEYRGVRISVSHHGADPKWNPYGTWCYYIHLHKDRFRDEEQVKKFFLKRKKQENTIGRHPFYYSYDDSAIDSCLDFHGGITFYEIKKSFSRNEKEPFDVAKIGCDYSHYHDEDFRSMYNEARLFVDARNTVNQFHEIADYLIWCQDDGELREEKDVEYREDKSYALKKKKEENQ